MHAGETFELLIDAAHRLNLKPKKETDYNLFSIAVNGKRHMLLYSICPLNSELGAYLASNKHATRLVLKEASLPNIPFCLPNSRDELLTFAALQGPLVGKPTRGRQSQGVRLYSRIAQLERAKYSDKIFEKYIAGVELRYLMLDKTVLAVHQRHFPGKLHRPELVTRESYDESKWDSNLIKIAQDTMQAIGLRFGAVDFIVTPDMYYILEVNSAPGLHYFKSPHSGPSIDIGRIYLESVAQYFDSSWKSPL